MDNRGKRQASSIFGGMGFYIALLVCVLAAGVVGYFALLNNNTVTPDKDPVQTVDHTDPGPTQSVSSNEDEPAQPVLSEEPVVVERPVPRPAKREENNTGTSQTTPVIDTAPVSVPEPPAVVAPLSGETVAVFSVDQLAYDATLGDWRTHDGIDIQAAAGTAVVAASAGTVLSVEQDDRLGTTVVIDHQNGHITTYASLQQETSVLSGDEVVAGQIIGTVGNTSLSEAGLGAHLHFSVTKDGEPIDPNAFLG